MSTLRSLRLLGAVESGNVNGPTLQSYLTDVGRASEFSVLLANRGQSRRMASSPLTMSAIVGSTAATDIVFRAATAATAAACQAVVVSPIAMNAVANNKPSLFVLGANPIAWNLFNTSIYYEPNVRTIIANYAGVVPASYPTVDSLILDPMSMADISATPFAMSAVVASPPSTSIMASNSAAMALVASNPVAIDIVAKQTSVMSIIANSPPAMTEIVSRSSATNRMASYPGAITAISKVPAAWASYLSGPFFGSNIALALANLIGVSPGNYPTLNSIIADANALALVAKNGQAVSALASSSSALSTLAASSNVGIVLGSATAMAVLGPNTSAMTSFLNTPSARAGLFASSVAKGFIAASTALVDVIAGNPDLITFLTGMSKVTAGPDVPDALSGVFQVFNGIPSKVLIVAVRGNHIAATYADYQLRGTPQAGSQAGAVLSLNAFSVPHVAAYTNLFWDLRAAAATAAGQIEIRYIDMT